MGSAGLFLSRNRLAPTRYRMTAFRDPKWHWPRFEQTLCGQMTDRERLGLPDRYVETSIDAALTQAYAELGATSSEILLDMLVSPASTLAARIVCGNLLALAGDPRISVERPDMVDVVGGDVEAGLPADEVGAVLEEFAGLGLERSWIEKKCPRHRVTLSPYRLARYPVTNTEYRAFLLDSG